jgi:hypothetical protein
MPVFSSLVTIQSRSSAYYFAPLRASASGVDRRSTYKIRAPVIFFDQNRHSSTRGNQMHTMVSVGGLCLALAFSTAASALTPIQQSYLHGLQAQCPALRMETRAPAELLDLQDTFRDRLNGVDRAQLDRALHRNPDGSLPACSQAMAGATCDTVAYLNAFEKTGFFKRFISSVCASGHLDPR